MSNQKLQPDKHSYLLINGELVRWKANIFLPVGTLVHEPNGEVTELWSKAGKLGNRFRQASEEDTARMKTLILINS